MLEGMTALQTSIGTEQSKRKASKSEHIDFHEINNISNIIHNITQLTPEITQLERKLGKLKKGGRDEGLEQMLKSIKDRSAHFQELQRESEGEHIGHVLRSNEMIHGDGAGAADGNTDDVINDALQATLAKLGPQDR
jgi:hypothetical protein